MAMDPLVTELMYAQIKDLEDPKKVRKVVTQSELVPFHQINAFVNGWKMFNNVKDREDPKPPVVKSND